MVYEILNKNNLCDYYDLNENPGISQKTEIRKGKFDYLDDEEKALPEEEQEKLRLKDKKKRLPNLAAQENKLADTFGKEVQG